jgi:hypothetical protein
MVGRILCVGGIAVAEIVLVLGLRFPWVAGSTVPLYIVAI